MNLTSVKQLERHKCHIGLLSSALNRNLPARRFSEGPIVVIRPRCNQQVPGHQGRQASAESKTIRRDLHNEPTPMAGWCPNLSEFAAVREPFRVLRGPDRPTVRV